MDVTRTPEWYNERVNDEARRQWAARPTGVACSSCGRDIVAVNEKAYHTIRANDGLFDMYCRECERGVW